MNNLNYIEYISFEELSKYINSCKIFDEIESFPFPNIDLIIKGLSNKINFKKNNFIKRINDWENYEYGRINFSDEFFFQLIIGKKIHQKNNYFLITNKSFHNKRVFKIKGNMMRQFIFNDYYELTKEPFFQPSDIIIFTFDDLGLSFINHDGFFLSFSNFKKIKKILS